MTVSSKIFEHVVPLFQTQEEVDRGIEDVIANEKSLTSLIFFLIRIGEVYAAKLLNELLPEKLSLTMIKDSEKNKYREVSAKFFNQDILYADVCDYVICNTEIDRQQTLEFFKDSSPLQLTRINNRFEQVKKLLNARQTEANLTRFVKEYIKHHAKDRLDKNPLIKSNFTNPIIAYIFAVYGSDALIDKLHPGLKNTNGELIHQYRILTNTGGSKGIKIFSTFLQHKFEARQLKKAVTRPVPTSAEESKEIKIGDPLFSLDHPFSEQSHVDQALCELSNASNAEFYALLPLFLWQLGFVKAARQIHGILLPFQQKNVVLPESQSSKFAAINPYKFMQTDTSYVDKCEDVLNCVAIMGSRPSFPDIESRFIEETYLKVNKILQKEKSQGLDVARFVTEFCEFVKEQPTGQSNKKILIRVALNAFFNNLFASDDIILQIRPEIMSPKPHDISILDATGKGIGTQRFYSPYIEQKKIALQTSHKFLPVIKVFENQKEVDMTILALFQCPLKDVTREIVLFLYRMEYFKAGCLLNELLPSELALHIESQELMSEIENKQLETQGKRFYQTSTSYADKCDDVISELNYFYVSSNVMMPDKNFSMSVLKPVFEKFKALIESEKRHGFDLTHFISEYCKFIKDQDRETFNSSFMLTMGFVKYYIANLYASDAIIPQIRTEISPLLRNEKSVIQTALGIEKECSSYMKKKIEGFLAQSSSLITKVKSQKVFMNPDDLKALSEQDLPTKMFERIEKIGLCVLGLNKPYLALQIFGFLPAEKRGNLTLEQIHELNPNIIKACLLFPDGIYLEKAVTASIGKFRNNKFTNDSALIDIFKYLPSDPLLVTAKILAILKSRGSDKTIVKLLYYYLSEIFTILMQSVVPIHHRKNFVLINAQPAAIADTSSGESKTELTPLTTLPTVSGAFHNQDEVDQFFLNFPNLTLSAQFNEMIDFLMKMGLETAANHLCFLADKIPAIESLEAPPSLHDTFYNADTSYSDKLFYLSAFMLEKMDFFIKWIGTKDPELNLFGKLSLPHFLDTQAQADANPTDFIIQVTALIRQEISRSQNMAQMKELASNLLSNYLFVLYASDEVIFKLRPEIVLPQNQQMDAAKSPTHSVASCKSTYVQKKRLLYKIKQQPLIQNYEQLIALNRQPFATKTSELIEQIGVYFYQLGRPDYAVLIFESLVLHKRGSLSFIPLKSLESATSIYTPAGNMDFICEALKQATNKFKNNKFTNHDDLIRLIPTVQFYFENFIEKLAEKIQSNAADGLKCAALYLKEFFNIYIESTLEPKDRFKIISIDPKSTETVRVESPPVSYEEAKVASVDKPFVEENKEAPEIPELKKAENDPVSLFNNKQQLHEAITLISKKIIDVNDFKRNVEMLYPLAIFLLLTGNIIASRKLLQHLEKSPEIVEQKTVITNSLQQMTQQSQALQREVANKTSYAFSLRITSRALARKDTWQNLRESVATKMYLPRDKRRDLLTVIDNLVTKPFNSESLVKCLIDNTIDLNLSAFILFEYCLVAFARPNGLTLASQVLPKFHFEAPVKKVRAPKVLSKVLNKPNDISHKLTIDEPLKVAVAEDKLAICTQVNGDRDLKPQATRQIAETKETAASPSLIFSESISLSSNSSILHSAVKRETLEPFVFSLPIPPAFLKNDRKLIKFEEMISDLNAKPQSQAALEDAYDKYVLFKHHILPLQESIDNPKQAPHAKFYRLALDSMLGAELAKRLAKIYIQESKNVSSLDDEIALTKDAIEKLDYARRYCYVDFECDELLIEQYRVRISQTMSIRDAVVAKKYLQQRECKKFLSAIELVSQQIKDKKTYIAKLKKHNPDCDIKEECLKAKSGLHISQEESSEDVIKGTLEVPILTDIPYGDAKACEEIAAELLSQSKVLTDDLQRCNFLLNSIELYQHVNCLLTIKSSELVEDSKENTVLLDYRDRVIATGKCEATYLLNLIYMESEDVVVLNRGKALLRNAIRYIRESDETTLEIVITLKNQEKLLDSKIAALKTSSKIDTASIKTPKVSTSTSSSVMFKPRQVGLPPLDVHTPKPR